MLYIRLAAPSAVTAEAGNAAIVQAAAQMLSLVLAGALWLWLGSIVILLGGILNAEMNKERDGEASPSEPSTPLDSTSPLAGSRG